MSEGLLLRCEDSLEGILTAIYDAFVYKNKFKQQYTDSIKIAIGESAPYSLFTQEIEIETNQAKVKKTIKAIQDKLGLVVYNRIIHALCHYSEDRGSIVLGYLVRAFKIGQRIDEYMTDSYVMETYTLSRKVYNEIDKFKGFIRFNSNGNYLFALIEPKCNVIPIIWEHFADRFPNENFIIYDNKRKFSYVHQAFGSGIFVNGKDMSNAPISKDDYFTSLWKQYFDIMGISERNNQACQNNLAPKWYRKNMVEFNEEGT